MRSENKAQKIQFLMRACMKNVSVSRTGYVAGDFFDIKPPQLVFQRWQDDEVDTFVGHFANCIG